MSITSTSSENNIIADKLYIVYIHVYNMCLYTESWQ